MQRRPMTVRLRLRLLALVLGPVLGACGGPAAPEVTYVRGTVAADALVLGVGLAFASPDAISLPFPSATVGELDPAGGGADVAAVLEPAPGRFLGPITAVDAEGGFALALPLVDDVPRAALARADEFLREVATLPGCELRPSVTDARLSAHAFAFPTVPGLYAVTAEAGLARTLAGDAPFDPGLPPEEAVAGRRVIAWLFADRDVDVATRGAGCVTGPLDLDVDLRLNEGWNQVAWQLYADLSGGRLRIAPQEGVVVTVLPVGE